MQNSVTFLIQDSFSKVYCCKGYTARVPQIPVEWKQVKPIKEM